MAIIESESRAEVARLDAGLASADLQMAEAAFITAGGDWVRWLIHLGERCATAVEPGKRMVAAIAVPCRAFASVLCAAGCVVARDPGASRLVAPDGDRLSAYFERLCALRPGTTVTVTSGEMRRVGRFLEVVVIGGERHLVIEQSGDRKHAFAQKIPLRGASSIAIRGIGLSCLMIGQVGLLEQEIRGGGVTLPGNHGLEQLLRVGRFASRGDKDIRSDVIATAADLPRRLKDAQPAVVVFDGADAFRRWKEMWRHAAWLVVLDRTSRQFDEGAALVEQEFIAGRCGDEDPLAELEVTAGVELMSFWGRRS